jgi:hypothetical protein
MTPRPVPTRWLTPSCRRVLHWGLVSLLRLQRQNGLVRSWSFRLARHREGEALIIYRTFLPGGGQTSEKHGRYDIYIRSGTSRMAASRRIGPASRNGQRLFESLDRARKERWRPIQSRYKGILHII